MQNLQQIEETFGTLTPEQAGAGFFKLSQPVHAIGMALELAEEGAPELAETLEIAAAQAGRLTAIMEQLRQRARGAELVG